MKNSYYSIAVSDLLFLQATFPSKFYNQTAVNAQQIAEKMLKSIVELMEPSCEGLLKSHSLRALYDCIKNGDSGLTQTELQQVNRDALSTLKDYYFDAKYPGDNFVNVTKEECLSCLQTMYSVVQLTVVFRMRHGLDTECCEHLIQNRQSGMEFLK